MKCEPNPMPTYNFKERFAPLVESGQKRQTIRKTAKRAEALTENMRHFPRPLGRRVWWQTEAVCVIV